MNPSISDAGTNTSIRIIISDLNKAEPLSTEYRLVIQVANTEEEMIVEQEDEDELLTETVKQTDKQSDPIESQLPTNSSQSESSGTSAGPIETPFTPPELVNQTDRTVKEQKIIVKISNADYKGKMSLQFSKEINLPANYTLWTSENEGRDRLSIKYVPSEETKIYVDDEKTDLAYNWKVLTTGQSSKRSLSESHVGFTEADKIQI